MTPIIVVPGVMASRLDLKKVGGALNWFTSFAQQPEHRGGQRG